jgi:glutamate synthase (NADPH/NADH) large chain
VRRHAAAYGDNPIYKAMLDVGGIYGYRRGEEHAWTPANVASLQHAGARQCS